MNNPTVNVTVNPDAFIFCWGCGEPTRVSEAKALCTNDPPELQHIAIVCPKCAREWDKDDKDIFRETMDDFVRRVTNATANR